MSYLFILTVKELKVCVLIPIWSKWNHKLFVRMSMGRCHFIEIKLLTITAPYKISTVIIPGLIEPIQFCVTVLILNV